LSVIFASTQSAWSQAMPSGVSSICKTNSFAPSSSTRTGLPDIPSRITPERNFSAAPRWTEKSTLPRPPLVCSLLSTPEIAVNVAPGPGNRTTILLGAWQ
jgi:hypothetical protein